jgi:hypothetical protein
VGPRSCTCHARRSAKSVASSDGRRRRPRNTTASATAYGQKELPYANPLDADDRSAPLAPTPSKISQRWPGGSAAHAASANAAAVNPRFVTVDQCSHGWSHVSAPGTRTSGTP